MQRKLDPPFYPGEVVTGRVTSLGYNHAALNVRGWPMLLDQELICWDALRSPAEVLAVDDKIKVMVQTQTPMALT